MAGVVARKSEVDKVQGAGLSRWGSVHSYRVQRQYTTGFDNSQGVFMNFIRFVKYIQVQDLQGLAVLCSMHNRVGIW